VFEPSDCTARDLNTLACGEVDGLVCNDNVAALGESRNDRGDGAERLSIDDSSGCTKMSSNIGFEGLVDVLSAVETRGTTGADTISAQGLDCSLFDGFGVDEVEVIVSCKVCYGSAIC
jgi:hypothetical protein